MEKKMENEMDIGGILQGFKELKGSGFRVKG